MMEKDRDAIKKTLAYFWSIVTILACVIVGAGVIFHWDNILPLFLSATAIIFGPVCGIMYLVEIKKGVLAMDDDIE